MSNETGDDSVARPRAAVTAALRPDDCPAVDLQTKDDPDTQRVDADSVTPARADAVLTTCCKDVPTTVTCIDPVVAAFVATALLGDAPLKLATE